jgi:hypothetical protein
MSTSAMNFPPRDRDSLFVSPCEPTHVITAWRRPHRFGRIAMMAIIMLAVQGGIFWQLHRSSAAKRQQVAAEMHDFQMRAQALRGEMEALQGRIGRTHDEIERLQADARQASSALTPKPAAPAVSRPPVQARPRPLRASRPSQPSDVTRPSPIVLDPGCANTPLGC